MDESRKTNSNRGQGFSRKYLKGKVIDIGAGADLVCNWAERFDIEDGDANRIMECRRKYSYDAVHSSHCLDHMHDPEDALLESWSLLKPGGFLVVVVPDEDLYEQGIQPSIFAVNYKAIFRLNKPTSWSPVSFDIGQLVGESTCPGFSDRLKVERIAPATIEGATETEPIHRGTDGRNPAGSRSTRLPTPKRLQQRSRPSSEGSGASMPADRPCLAPAVDVGDTVLCLPAQSAPHHLHNKRYREPAHATTQDHEEPGPLPQR